MYKYFIATFVFLLTINIYAKEKMSLLIPLYSHPSVWNSYLDRFEIIKKNNINTYVIINPYNGPNTSVDKSYIEGIKLLKKYNINILGYVHTSYSKRASTLVKKDILAWKTFYQDNGVEGIFFDETSTLKKDIPYYVDLNKYLREQGFYFLALNAGYTTNKEYINLKFSDVIVTYENSYSNWQKSFPVNTNIENDFTKLSLLLYGINIKDFKSTIALADKKGFSYIYLTEDTLDNPWDELSKYKYQNIK